MSRYFQGAFNAVDGNRARARDVEALDTGVVTALDLVEDDVEALQSLFAGAPFISTVSSSTLTIALGAISFIAETGKSIARGMLLRLSAVSDTTKFMVVRVESYTSSTGAITGTVIQISETTGSFASWTVVITGESGIPDPVGNENKVLSSNGTSASWQYPNTSALLHLGII
jgi:hypothetical protein